MSRKQKPPQVPSTPNPVAKFASRFNKSATFRDGKTYSRQVKHKGREPFPIRAI